MDRGTAELQTNDEQLVNIETEQASIDNAVCTFLLENNRLKTTDLKRAESYREQHGGDLVTLLVRLGLVSERDVAEAESDLLELPLVRTADLPDEIPEYSCTADADKIWLPKLLVESGLVKGTGEGRRMIKQNAVSLDGVKIDDDGIEVDTTGQVLLKVGKRRFCLVKFC